MNIKVEPEKLMLNRLKWLAIVLIIGGSIVANHIYIGQPWPLRLLVGLVLSCVALAVAWRTKEGQRIICFASESRQELRKVVWPTRQETMHTTLVVAIVVVALALILWGIDGLLMWIIGILTGQRG